MWIVKTKNGIIRSKHISYSVGERFLHLQSKVKVSLSREKRNWQWLWLRKITIRWHEEEYQIIGIIPAQQLISIIWEECDER